MRKIIIGLVASAFIALGVQAVATAPAEAHFNTSDSAALCGGGYNLVYQVVHDFQALDVRRAGTSYCVVARKFADHGVNTYMWVGIKPHANSTYNNVDEGYYAHFAGPRYVTAANCVDVFSKQQTGSIMQSHGGVCVS